MSRSDVQFTIVGDDAAFDALHRAAVAAQRAAERLRDTTQRLSTAVAEEEDRDS